MPRERKSSQTKTRNSKRNGSSEVAPAPGSKEDRRAKLEIYLKDFDLQTESNIKAMNAREKEMVQKLEQEWALYRMKIPPQVMSMKLTEFMDKYKGDIAIYNRQFASADDSLDNLLDTDTDLNPKSVTTGKSGDKTTKGGAGKSNNDDVNKNNNHKNAGMVASTDEPIPATITPSSSSSSPRKRHSDEENQESSDTLAPLPAKNAAINATSTKKLMETPAHSAPVSKLGAFETPAGSRAPLVACTPSNTRAPRRSEIENPNLASKLVLYQESKSGSPLAQDLSDLGTPELKKIQAQIDRMMKMKTKP